MVIESLPTDFEQSGAKGPHYLAPVLRWRVPIFLLGVLALAGVWLLRPLWRSHQAHSSVDVEIASMRQAVEPATLNTSLAISVGEDLLERMEQFPERAAEIHFLLGSAYLRRATEVSQEQATFAWQKARQHLDQAVGLKVPESDRPRLMSRLG